MMESKNRQLEDLLMRHIGLIRTLQIQRGTIPFLANESSVCYRTIQRDLNYLQDLGIRLSYNGQTYEWTIDGGNTMIPVDFSWSEAFSILVLFHKYGPILETFLFNTIKTAAIKISSLINPDLLGIINNIYPHVDIFHAQTPYDDGGDEFRYKIFEAMERGCPLLMEYDGPSDPGPIKTKIYPYSLLFFRSWYFFALADLYHEVRTFKICRVKSLQLLKEESGIPVDFSIEKYLKNAWRFIVETEKDWKVRVRFSERVAQNVSEIRWHRTQEARFLPDGKVELSFQVSALSEIQWWILGYGSEAEVLEPVELKKMVFEQIQGMAALYEG